MTRFNLKMAGFTALAAGMTLAGAAAVSAATVDLPAVQDATLLGGADATTNQSLADPGIFVGTDGAKNPKRGLIEFDVVDNIPADATITGVTLQMDLGQVAGSGGGSGSGSGPTETISLYNETQAWGQPTNVAGSTSFSGSGHGGTPATGDATWNYAKYTSSSWSVIGGNYTSAWTDQGDASVGTTLTTSFWSSAAMVADVQAWLDGTMVNDGWLLKNADETDAQTFRAFWSAQGAAAYLAANPTNPADVSAPELIVTYSVPEPATLAIAGGAGMMLLVRRRK